MGIGIEIPISSGSPEAMARVRIRVDKSFSLDRLMMTNDILKHDPSQRGEVRYPLVSCVSLRYPKYLLHPSLYTFALRVRAISNMNIGTLVAIQV